VPRGQLKEIIRDLEIIFEKIGRVDEIVILGDLKHEFGIISEQEWKETLAVLDFLKTKCEKIVLIRGNHDKILGPIAEKLNQGFRNEIPDSAQKSSDFRHSATPILLRDFYIIDDFCFIHGNLAFEEIYGKKIKFLVMGHRHPAVMISDKYKKERYKCFLVGKWKKKKVIILPSFFPLVEGSDIINSEEKNLLFIPESKLRDFCVYAVSGLDVLKFGKLGKIERLE